MTESKLFAEKGPVNLSSGQSTEKIKPTLILEEPDKRTEKPSYQTTPDTMETYPTKPVEEPKPVQMIPQLKQPTPPYVPSMTTSTGKDRSNLEKCISTSWSPSRISPVVDERSFVHPRALVVGNVRINSGVFVAPFAAIRGDEEEPIYIGEKSAVLEGAVINALPTRRGNEKISQRLIKVGDSEHPVYISQMVTISQGVMIHGPVYVGKNTFIGMGALIFWAKIGSYCVIEPGALVINVEIPDSRFVPAGLSVTSQKIVSSLPLITDKYRFEKINEEMLAENGEIVNGYLRGG